MMQLCWASRDDPYHHPLFLWISSTQGNTEQTKERRARRNRLSSQMAKLIQKTTQWAGKTNQTKVKKQTKLAR